MRTGTAAAGTDRETTEWLNRSIQRVVALAMSFMAALVALSPTLLIGTEPIAVETAALAVLTAWLLVLLVAVLRGSHDLRVVAPLPFLALAASAALLLTRDPDRVVDGQHWLVHPTVIAANLALLLFPAVRAWVLITLLWVSVVLLNQPAMGWSRSVAQTLVLVLGPYVVLLMARLLAARLVHLRVAGAERARATERASVAAASAVQQATWDRLIHDEVLGALVLSLRVGVEDTLGRAAAAARAALQDLGRATRETRARGTDWTLAVERRARSLGLDPLVRVNGPLPPPEVADAMENACRQALANVAQHAQTPYVTVLVDQSPDRVEVTVSDRGRGFVPDEVPADRFGVRQSIPGHLASVGGTGVVESAPGHGTTVRLGWSAAGRAPVPVPPVLRGVQRLPLVRIVMSWAAVHLLLGSQYLEGVRMPWLSAAGLVCFVVGVALVVRSRWTAWVLPSTVLLVTACALFTLGADPVRGSDGRLWYAGAIMPTACVLALMGRARAGMALGTGCLLVMVLGWGLTGGVGPALGALEAGAQLVVFPLICVLLDRTLRLAASRTVEAERLTAQERVRASAATARFDEARRRTAQLEREVIPLLRRLASGEVLDDAGQQALRRAEASTRDGLVGGDLVDDAVRESARAARLRGARVELTAVEPTDGAPATDAAGSAGDEDPALVALRSATVLLLGAAGEGSHLIARWFARSRYEVGTVLLDTPAGRVPLEQLRRVLEPVAYDLDADEDVVMVRLQPTG